MERTRFKGPRLKKKPNMKGLKKEKKKKDHAFAKRIESTRHA
jgi:hypothetical protein